MNPFHIPRTLFRIILALVMAASLAVTLLAFNPAGAASFITATAVQVKNQAVLTPTLEPTPVPPPIPISASTSGIIFFAIVIVVVVLVGAVLGMRKPYKK